MDLRSVAVDDGFWSPRLRRNREQTLPFAYERCETSGALHNFARAAGVVDGPFRGRYYSDSDVYKWVESACWALAHEGDAGLEQQLATVVDLIVAAQSDDGYLNTYFSVDRADERWSDLVNKHEMYCLGHLVQAAVAQARAVGDTTLLEVALRAVELVERRYGPGVAYAACGHPGLELALVELYRLTGSSRWLDLARWQLASRGRGALNGTENLLDHAPVTQQREITGHAVRALYLYAAMADVVLETGDAELASGLDALWEDLTGRKTSVTGGVGARWDGESFGDAYELPDRAYNETCAAIAVVLFGWRMLLRTGDGRYRDTIEWTLYNAVLPGLSASGTDFFYQNPIADAGRHRREAWFDCACCPPNITRMLASLPGYLASTSAGAVGPELWIHLLIGGTVIVPLADGVEVSLTATSSLPWAGTYELEVHLDAPAAFVLRIPAPAWSERTALSLNGSPLPAPTENGYHVIDRLWSPGDRLRAEYQVDVRLLAAHPHVATAHHRVAVSRGPLVYCVEQVDHESDVLDLRLTGRETWVAQAASGLPDIQALTTTAGRARISNPLPYAPLTSTASEVLQPAEMVAIPYFAWANRTPGRMTVFLPLAGEASP